MHPIHTRFGDAVSVLVTMIGLMIVAAAGVGLTPISVELAELAFGFVSVSWGKLLSFLTVLMIIHGLALVVGKHLRDAELPRD